MTNDLRAIVETSDHDADRIASQRENIHESVLAASAHLDAANFTSIHPDDLGRLFAEYDRRFFRGRISAALGPIPLRFRLSKRMTSAAGKTARYRQRRGADGARYEISVSTTLLFQCFTDDDHRAVTASGLSCADRLDALQRVVEHELVHLVEMILWARSSCAALRFQTIAQRLFGHREHTHQLITQRERAQAMFGIHPGDPVRFRVDGVGYTGFVNRITRRATVLVKDDGGRLFTDGHRYATYYVPLELLELLTSGRQDAVRG